MTLIVNLHNKQIDPTALEEIKSLPEEKRFDRFLQEDLRLPPTASYYPNYPATGIALVLLGSKLISWAEDVKELREGIRRKYIPKLPFNVIAIFSLPFFGYYISTPSIHNCHRYHVQSTFPAVALVSKTPCPIDWSSLVGTQFFHQIDWHDVGISDYRPDSVFVLFSPKVTFKKTEQYVACFDTTNYLNLPEQPKIKQPEQKNETNTIDLVKVNENTYAPKIYNPLKSLKKHLLGPLRSQRALERHRAKAKVFPTVVTQYLKSAPQSKTGAFQNLRTLDQIPTTKLQRVRNPQRNLFGFEKKFRKTSNLTTYWTTVKARYKRPVVKSPRITNIVSSRNHHLLIPLKGVEQLSKNLDSQITSQHLASQYYWQTYFSAYDLLPSKMESMTFGNKPRLSTAQQYIQDMKIYDKDSKSLDASNIMPMIKHNRDVRQKHYIQTLKKNKQIRQNIQENHQVPEYNMGQVAYDRRLLNTTIDKSHFQPETPKNLMLLNTETLRHKKHSLVSEDRHQTLDWHLDNPSSMDQLQDDSKHKTILKANWKNKIKQRYLLDYPEWWSEEKFDQQIAPLFSVSGETPVPTFKHVDTHVDLTKLSQQDPPSKIYLLTEAINQNLQKALDSKLAVRQSTRYLIHNSLFNFKSLISRNVNSSLLHRVSKNQGITKPHSLKLKTDFILQDSKKDKPTLNLRCLKSELVYESILEDANWFNPYENFPYFEVNDIQVTQPSVLKPGEFSPQSQLQREEKGSRIDPLRTKRYGIQETSQTKKKRRSKKVNQSKVKTNGQNKTSTQLNKSKDNKTIGNTTPIFTEFKLNNIEILDEVIKQKLKNKQESINKILAYAKVVYHPFFNKTKDDIQHMIDIRNTSVLKELNEINDKFEAETFGKIKKIRTELEQMQKHREEYYTELIQLYYSFRNQYYQSLAEPDKTPEFPIYFYSFPGDNIEQNEYEKTTLKNHPLFNFLRFRHAPDEQVYRNREKAILEMCHSKWRSEPFAKAYELTKHKAINAFMDQFPQKQIPEEYKAQAFELFETELLNNFHMNTGKLTAFDASEQKFVFRDQAKAALANLDLEGEKTTELDFPFELCSANEIVEPNKPVETEELFTRKQNFNKFRFDSLRQQYQSFLLTNPFRVLPITQNALFLNMSRDLIQHNFYQHYVDWYEQFFLQNLNIIKPVFELDQILNPEKQNAYLKYSKVIDSSFSEQKLKAPVENSEIENFVNQQKIQAAFDKKQTEETYNQLEQKEILEKKETERLNNQLKEQVKQNEENDEEDKFKDVEFPQNNKKPYSNTFDNLLNSPTVNNEHVLALEDSYRQVDELLPPLNHRTQARNDWLLHQRNLRFSTAEQEKDFRQAHFEGDFVDDRVAKSIATDDLIDQSSNKIKQQTNDQTNQIEKQQILDSVDQIQNLTLEDLFKDQLVYYLKSKEKTDEMFNERLMLNKNQNIDQKKFKPNPVSEKRVSGDNEADQTEQTLIDQTYLQEAYKEISNIFGWTQAPISQEASQSKLNQEIAEAFIQSKNKAWAKSKHQTQAEVKTKQAIRNRVIQGHSPYLQRQLSGYINPDASFRLKTIELLGWQNVYEKARQMYNISQKSENNKISAVRFSLIKRWGKLSTINSPFYQITSSVPYYHYECFSRLINNRTTALFDFKQLNLHTIYKAGDPSRSAGRVNYFGKTKTPRSPIFRVPLRDEDTKKLVMKDEEPYSVWFYRELQAKQDEEIINLKASPKEKQRRITEENAQKQFKRNSLLRSRGITSDDILAPETMEFQDIFYDSPKSDRILNNIESIADTMDLEDYYDSYSADSYTDDNAKEYITQEHYRDLEKKIEKRISRSNPENLYQPLDKKNLDQMREKKLDQQTEKKFDQLLKKQNPLDRNYAPEDYTILQPYDLKKETRTYDQILEGEEKEIPTPDFYENILDRRLHNWATQRGSKAKTKNLLYEAFYTPKAINAQKAMENPNLTPQDQVDKPNKKTRNPLKAIKNMFQKREETYEPLYKYTEDLEHDYIEKPEAKDRIHFRKKKKRLQRVKKEDDPAFPYTSRIRKIKRMRQGPLYPLSDLYKYKNNIGVQSSRTSLAYDDAALLLNANSLMNKVRHRYFSGTASGYIDHTRFNFSHEQNKKWLTFKHEESSLHTGSKTGKSHRMVLLNVSVTSPAFWSYILVLYWLAKHFNRFRLGNEGNISFKFAKFLEKIDFETASAFFKTHNSVMRCHGIGFNQMIGGKKLFQLFYPLIILNRNKHFSFGTLPIFEYRLLQKLASASVDLVKKGDKYELSVLKPTEKEIALAREFEQARGSDSHLQRNCLLIGPPGTGKTFFVKALASESHIPVIIPSRHELQLKDTDALDNFDPSSYSDEVLRMTQFFKIAHKQKPCILFLDEIDSMAKNRNDVQLETGKFYPGAELVNERSLLLGRKAFGAWNSTVSVSSNILNFDRLNPEYHAMTNPIRAMHDVIEKQRDLKLTYEQNANKTAKPIPQEPENKASDPVSKLTQLLTLVDQTNPRHVLIIGATNRPDSLDPAITRPGRLNNILYLDLPSKQKRLELLRFYSRSRLAGPIDWDYFAKQTTGLSPAHLEVAMNFSALKNAYEIIEQRRTNQNKVKHSEDSVEYGIKTIKNTSAFSQGLLNRLSKKLNLLGAPLFFMDIGKLELWQHVSLGSPIRPIMVSPPALSKTMVSEKLPTKAETQVWNRMPNHIPRVSFPTLYHKANLLVSQSLQNSQVTKTTRKPSKKDATVRRKLRERFYQRHRKVLRAAYLLSDPKTIDYSLLNNVTINDHPLVNGLKQTSLLDQASCETLQLFKNYVERVFKFHMFGCKLLLHTTYSIGNPLMFKTEYIYRKQNEMLVRSSGQFIRFRSRTPLYLQLLLQSTLFVQPKRVEKKLTRMFSNSLALHRSVAYNASKALMVHLLTDTYQQDHMYDIWNRVKYEMGPEQYKRIFIKAVKEHFVTRKDFENYLLALSAGKVGEHLMLFYREALPQYDPFKPRFGRYTYDVSEIGKQELNQMSWLLNIMIEKNLFYSPTVDLSKQALVAENRSKMVSKHNKSIVSVAVNKELWSEFDRKTYGYINKYEKGLFYHNFMKLFRAKPKQTYWWSTTEMLLPSHPDSSTTIVHWVNLFERIPYKMTQVPKDLHYDTYRANILRTPSLLDSPFDAKYLPPNFVEWATKQGGTWNQHRFSTTERITRAILLDTFAKSFYILTSQRELCDHLSYYLFRHGKIQANQIKKLCEIFLEPELSDRRRQREKNKEIDEILKNL